MGVYKDPIGHTKLMFRITDFSGHFLGGEGGGGE